MRGTLLIPLVGPLQAWGVDARFDLRPCGMEPSKSGVIGLCCAAMGRDRAEPIEDLSSLLFGVRVDKEGLLSRDFHTAKDVIGAGDGKLRTVVSNRWYLAHAAFLAGLQGPTSVLATIHKALNHPHWTLALGRKSCPPTIPPGSGGVVDLPLQEALVAHEPLVAEVESYRLVLEDPHGSQSRPDQPLGPFIQRRFGMRRVSTITVSVPASTDQRNQMTETPFLES